jgi:hypothetical protein
LTVNYTSTEGGSSQTACNSYLWNGSTYTTSGAYTYTTLNGSGCTNTATLNLTVNYTSTTGGSSQTACDTYIWNGSTYTTSGAYTYTSLNGVGCTNTATLNLVVNYSSTTGGSSHVACDSYTWNGSTYSTSGTYTFTTMNASGCTNTATLGLTVNYSTTNGNATISSCDSYLWNGITYTASGVYTYTSLNIAGCTNTATLTLTIKHSSTSGSTSTGCDYYTWAANGVTYTQSGVYVTTLTNAVGCDSVHTLTFYIRHSNAGSTNVTSCNSHTWTSGDGQTYTSSANPTYTYINQEGCDSVHTLHITINYSNTGSSNYTSCNSYLWEGNNYTSNANPTHMYQNVLGCDSLHTLHLTINYSNTGSSNMTNCNSYVWEGNTYTASGNPTHIYQNAVGCDSLHTLHLTIKYSTTGSSNITSCNSYVWEGNTYTTSGIPTHMYQNAVGCDSLHSLQLTINYSNTGSSSLIECDTYTWHSVTYTSSTVATHMYQNALGCDSLHTLNLTVRYKSYSTISRVDTVSYTWPVTGLTYSLSGAYVGTYHSNASGCDSVITLNLTIYGIRVRAKVFLDGPYNSTTGLMNDSLRSKNLIPTSEPYTSMIGFPALFERNGETISQGVLNVTGNNAIVDWVYLELRTGAPSYSKVATRRGLVQRDGDIVDMDGVTPVTFRKFLPGSSYFVSVKHRNHLGVMTNNAIPLTLAGAVLVDFTDTVATPLYKKVIVPASLMVNKQTKQYGAVSTLWSGDAKTNKNTKYNGLSNDKDLVLAALPNGDVNATINNVYRAEDVNLDGMIRFNNTNNDRAVILGTVGVSTPNNIYNQHTPD